MTHPSKLDRGGALKALRDKVKDKVEQVKVKDADLKAQGKKYKDLQKRFSQWMGRNQTSPITLEFNRAGGHKKMAPDAPVH